MFFMLDITNNTNINSFDIRRDEMKMKELQSSSEVLNALVRNNNLHKSLFVAEGDEDSIKKGAKDVQVFEDFSGYGMSDSDLIDIHTIHSKTNKIICRYNGRMIERLKNDPCITPRQEAFLKTFCTKATKANIPEQYQARMNTRRQNAPSTASEGFNYPITTMTYIYADTITQIYPQDNVYEKFAVDREGTWANEVTKNVEQTVIQPDISSYAYEGANNQSIQNVTTNFSHETFGISTFVFEIPSNFLIEQQAGYVKINLPDVQIRAATAAWNNLYAKSIYVGSSGNQINGAITDPNVLIDISTFGGLYLSQMTPTQLNTVFQNFVTEAYANANAAIFPDTFVFSSFDGVGQGALVSTTFPTDFQIRKALEHALIEACKSSNIDGSNIKIMVSPFVDKKLNGIKTQYMLYNRAKENMAIQEPFPLTINSRMSYDGWHTTQIGWMRSGGVAYYRPTAMTQFFIN